MKIPPSRLTDFAFLATGTVSIVFFWSFSQTEGEKCSFSRVPSSYKISASKGIANPPILSTCTASRPFCWDALPTLRCNIIIGEKPVAEEPVQVFSGTGIHGIKVIPRHRMLSVPIIHIMMQCFFKHLITQVIFQGQIG